MNPVSEPVEAREMALWWRLVLLCMPEEARVGVGMFEPESGGDLERDWDGWVAGVFNPVVREVMSAQRDAVVEGNFRRMLAMDRELGRGLPEGMRQRSLVAGRRILEECGMPRGVRSLDRLRRAAGETEDAGHLATVFAVRGETFHFPLLQLTGALLLAECMMGAAAVGVTLTMSELVVMLRRAMGGAFSPRWTKEAV